MEKNAKGDIVQSCFRELFCKRCCSLVMFGSHEFVKPILTDEEYCSDWVEKWHTGT